MQPTESPTPPAAVPTKFYRPELDALRAFAFLMVFIHHSLFGYSLALLLPGIHNRAFAALDAAVIDMGQGFSFGVGLFFVLSSYLISTLLLIERQKTSRVQFKAFYLRRALRIWPLYFAFVILCVPLGLAWPDLTVTGRQVAAFSFFAGNWFLVWHSFNGSPMNFLWSVCLEEQFYLIWPAVVAWRGVRSLLGSCIAVLLTAVFTLALLAHLHTHVQSGVWCNSFVQFAFFAAGGLLAIRYSRRVPAFSYTVRGLLLGFGVAVLIVAAATTHIKSAETLPFLPLMLGYSMSLAGVLAIFCGFLGLPAASVPNWLRHLGRISYGLYVFHAPSIDLVPKAMQAFAHAVHASHLTLILLKAGTPLVCLGVTIAVAHFSYKFLEAPFLRLKDRFTIVRSREV